MIQKYSAKQFKIKPTILKTLWVAFAAFVPLVLVANIAVAAVPHKRGIEFLPQFRYAVITPVCLLAAIGTAFLYREFIGRIINPRWSLFVSLSACAVVILILFGVSASQSLLITAASTIVSMTLALALIVPRFVEKPRGRFFGALIIIFGIVEIFGVGMAISSERANPVSAGNLAFDVPRSVFDAEHKFIELPSGARIHYVDEGQGETLLFLHGNPAWSFQWRELIKGLRGSYRCVALDYPGFGLSTAPPGFGYTPREQSIVLEEFVDALNLREMTFVMQDWGGPIGLGLAGRRPELVKRFVLGNTWTRKTELSEARGIFSVIAGGAIGEFVQMNFNGFTSFAISQGVVKELPSEAREMYLRPFRPLDRRGIAAFYPGQIIAADDYFAEVEAGLENLRDRRTLIFWGLRDPGMPRADLEGFERIFPNHKTIELPDADHFFFEDAAPLMIEEIKTFAVDQ